MKDVQAMILARGIGFMFAAAAAGLLLATLATNASAGLVNCPATLPTGCAVSVTNDGRAFFSSPEQLTEEVPPFDYRTSQPHVFVRTAGDTQLLSVLPSGKPFPAVVSRLADGGRALFLGTDTPLASNDTNAGGQAAGDFYAFEPESGDAELITTGPTAAVYPDINPGVGGQNLWASADGDIVYFGISARLVEEDYDYVTDVYQRRDGLTRLISVDPNAPPVEPSPERGRPNSFVLAVTPGGSTVFFASRDALTPDDAPETWDIFAWSDGSLRRVTPDTPDSAFNYFETFRVGGATYDGAIFYTASSSLTPDDTDTFEDVYVSRADGSTTLLTGETPGETCHRSVAEEVTPDGRTLFLTSCSSLVPADTDSTDDIYRFRDGAFTLVTAGPQPFVQTPLLFGGASEDGDRAVFETDARLVDNDTDDRPDVYEWFNGALSLVSPASAGADSWAQFEGISPNGLFVAFKTVEPILGSDTDARVDSYLSLRGPVSSRSKVSRAASRRRIRLITAEVVAPRMGLARRGRRTDSGLKVRLHCPKTEISGPCRGRVRVGGSRLLARGRFSVRAGRSRTVQLSPTALGRKRLANAARLRVKVRVRAADALGNTRRTYRRVTFRR